MKKILLIIVILLIGISTINIYKKDFTNSIFIITKDNETQKIEYWEINDKKDIRKTNKFKTDKIKVLSLNNCYKYYFDQELNKGIDETSFDTCKIMDENNNTIKLDDEIKNILTSILNLKHSIIYSETKIITLNNQYYVVVALNVNMWSPYRIYHYNKDNNYLGEIYTFDNKNVIGIKIK